MKATLILENGRTFVGESIGGTEDRICEMVFNTSMVGYQEILTDPSYAGQGVVMSYPLIGNYGVNHEDNESVRPWAEAFVVRCLSERGSNFRNEGTLDAYLKEHNITGLQGIDLLTAEDTVLVFFGKGQTLANVKKLCAGTKAQVQYLESVKGGKNSLDFQIITELGVLVGRGEADFAYVISQDKGYEAAMSALHARYASTFREVALRPSIQDCLQAAFLLRAGTREELAAALARQYGPVQGQLAYEHLEALLTPPPVQEAAAPSPAPENKAASKPGKRRSRAAAKPAETAEPAPAQSAPQDAEEPAGTAEPAAPAARSRRSGASRRRKRAERSKAEKA